MQMKKSVHDQINKVLPNKQRKKTSLCRTNTAHQSLYWEDNRSTTNKVEKQDQDILAKHIKFT